MDRWVCVLMCTDIRTEPSKHFIARENIDFKRNLNLIYMENKIKTNLEVRLFAHSSAGSTLAF